MHFCCWFKIILENRLFLKLWRGFTVGCLSLKQCRRIKRKSKWQSISGPVGHTKYRIASRCSMCPKPEPEIQYVSHNSNLVYQARGANVLSLCKPEICGNLREAYYTVSISKKLLIFKIVFHLFNYLINHLKIGFIFNQKQDLLYSITFVINNIVLCYNYFLDSVTRKAFLTFVKIRKLLLKGKVCYSHNYINEFTNATTDTFKKWVCTCVLKIKVFPWNNR